MGYWPQFQSNRSQGLFHKPRQITTQSPVKRFCVTDFATTILFVTGYYTPLNNMKRIFQWQNIEHKLKQNLILRIILTCSSERESFNWRSATCCSLSISFSLDNCLCSFSRPCASPSWRSVSRSLLCNWRRNPSHLFLRKCCSRFIMLYLLLRNYAICVLSQQPTVSTVRMGHITQLRTTLGTQSDRSTVTITFIHPSKRWLPLHWLSDQQLCACRYVWKQSTTGNIWLGLP